MNPLAGQLNESIKAGNEHVYDMLSTLGKEIYFPKEGILSQSAEAGAHAKKYNATIGIATEGGVPMHLGVIQDKLSAYSLRICIVTLLQQVNQNCVLYGVKRCCAKIHR